MNDDNTPTVTSRRRKPSGHQRLRLQTAQRLQALSKKIKARRQAKKDQKTENEITVIAGGPSEIAAPEKSTKEDVNAKRPKIKKSKLREPPLPPAKFRKRQINKTWLPTHLWHSKRARMTPPKEPMWRFALPVTPHVKTYRNVHRASADKGAIAWDTSYKSTIGLEGPEQSITGMLKALGVSSTHHSSDPWSQSGSKWRAGTRIWEGCLHERDIPSTVIAPVTVIWNPFPVPDQQDTKKKSQRKVFIRVHPSAFVQLWEQVIRLAKVQKPSVSVEDLRFEIGSVEITGPNASEALVAVLRPIGAIDETNGNLTAQEMTWLKLAATPPASLPSNALLSLIVTDPRLRHPPRTLPTSDLRTQDPMVIQLLTNWPLDRSPHPSAIFDRVARQKACRALSAQNAINRRKAQADPGEYPKPLLTDPNIPILAFASRSGSGGAGTWSVLLPWKCVDPVWKSLVYYPLSTGGNIRFGGVNEHRQIAYENGIPWFPADFPATLAGQQWELEDSARRKAEWDRKPKSRRKEFESVPLGDNRKGEIGLGWSCDWPRLISDPLSVEEDTVMKDMAQLPKGARADQSLHQIPLSMARRTAIHGAGVDLPNNALATVKVSMLGQGRPDTCARIYRLPTNKIELREKWLAQQPTANSARGNSKTARFPPKPGRDASAAMHRSWLAAAILAPPPEPGSKDYPVVPDEVDLIGFVTTGNFSLKEGKGMGIGSLIVNRILPQAEDWTVDRTGKQTLRHERYLCIVRDAGQSHGRLARWEFV
jgi:ribonuclease P/MRP protein subunit POP1